MKSTYQIIKRDISMDWYQIELWLSNEIIALVTVNPLDCATFDFPRSLYRHTYSGGGTFDEAARRAIEIIESNH